MQWLAFQQVIAQQLPVDSAKLVKEQEGTERKGATPEVVVTATRTERELKDIPLPLTIITREQIQASGAVRLADILQLQTGFAVVHDDHGTGIQVQGFGSSYVLILIDGEPMVGRTAGTMDLNRFTVQNIERIEVIKGPASSLYGSDALGGVINIITQPVQEGLSGLAKVRYGSNNTSDLTGLIEGGKGRWRGQAFINHFNTSGYTLRPEAGSPTVPPYYATTVQSKWSYRIGEHSKLSLNLRGYDELQSNWFPLQRTGALAAEKVNDELRNRDWVINPVFTTLVNKFRLTARLYSTGFNSINTMKYDSDGGLYFRGVFNQTFTRAEFQSDWMFSPRSILTTGAGEVIETVNATRFEGFKSFNSRYVFVQEDWSPCDWASFLVGARYDNHSQYRDQLSPKIAVQLKATRNWNFHANVGRGFRAPDFRQLYLDFDNPIIGYSVYGTNSALSRIRELQQRAQVQIMFMDPGLITDLRPERSLSFNAGTSYSRGILTHIGINFFHNTISDMIVDIPVLMKTNSQPVYSYMNKEQVITRGLEFDLSIKPHNYLTIAGGYQFLDSYDAQARKEIEEGKLFYRTAGSDGLPVTRRLRSSDYLGLLNRSRHSGNIRATFNHAPSGWEATVTTVYRGAYGLSDSNGNGVFDRFDTQVSGFTLINCNVAKSFKNGLKAQVGIDNINNFKNIQFLPLVPGRLWFVSLQYKFNKSS